MITRRNFLLGLGACISTEAVAFTPPLQYDHRYRGEMHYKRLPFGRLQEVCRKMMGLPRNYKRQMPKGKAFVGCADVHFNSCTMYTLDKPYKGLSVNKMFRHERAHCNGWVHANPFLKAGRK